jgi:ribosomal protein L7/L12
MRAVDPARARIVLVGTPAYDDPGLPGLPAVAHNLMDLAQVLTDPALGGFGAAQVVVAPPRAGVAQIGDLLVDAAEQAENLLLFYFSGHGLLGPLRRELYLGLAGTRPDRLAFTALPFDAVRDACLASPATNRVVILDSCYSGRAIGETLAGDDEAVLGQIQVAGTYTLASAPANRTALSLPGERNTAFTGRMLEFLRAGSAEAGPLISLGDIYRHLWTRLRSEGLPTPQQRGTETADQLGLVRNAFGAQRRHDRAQPTNPPSVPEPGPGPAGESEFDVLIVAAGSQKISVIKVVRELTTLGLKEAKDLVDNPPQPVLERVGQSAAELVRARLELAGATVAVRSHADPQAAPEELDVVITASGDRKVSVIKIVRELTFLGLKEAKDLVDGPPQPVLRRVGRETAAKAKRDLEKAGATVAVGPSRELAWRPPPFPNP